MDIQRKLVTVRCVSALDAIPGADQIEVATVDGWKCVVKKGDFSVGSLGLYFEIDSVLPDQPQFEFMRHRHFRVRTIKLRGQVSQGLLMPFSTFPSIDFTQDGLDLDVLLDVKKYELPIPPDMAARVRGNFPSFISKTDQERCQNLVKELAEKNGLYFEVTEKLEGSSMTVYWFDGVFGVCSRNLDLKEAENPEENCTQWKVARKFDLENKLRIVGDGYALQGELIGPGVQGNYYKLAHNQFRIFDVYDIHESRYLAAHERLTLLKTMGIDDMLVPVVDPDFCLTHTVGDLLNMADGQSALGLEPILREGLVFKSKAILNGNTFSFKAISNAFLLKQE